MTAHFQHTRLFAILDLKKTNSFSSYLAGFNQYLQDKFGDLLYIDFHNFVGHTQFGEDVVVDATTHQQINLTLQKFTQYFLNERSIGSTSLVLTGH